MHTRSHRWQKKFKPTKILKKIQLKRKSGEFEDQFDSDKVKLCGVDAQVLVALPPPAEHDIIT